MTSENLPHLQECNETFERVRSAFSCIASYLSKTSLPCTLRLIMLKYFLLHCWRCFLRTLGNAHVCVLTFVALRGRPVWLHKLINQLRVLLMMYPHTEKHIQNMLNTIKTVTFLKNTSFIDVKQYIRVPISGRTSSHCIHGPSQKQNTCSSHRLHKEYADGICRTFLR